MRESSRSMVERLSSYRSVLCKLKTLGFVKVFSDNLGDALGISASQVRKDFSQFELKGNKKGGYQVDELIERLNEILGKNEVQDIIIVGCGKIGTALMNYNRFTSEGIRVVAGFDTDPTVIRPDARIPVLDLSELESFVERHGIRIAIMTVPEPPAPQVYERLVNAGIEGILNFTPMQLRSSGSCLIQNVNIEREIENLFYFINLQNRE
ncbi:MAG: redox-sensing transcriptional repressor Rex [Candidatus Pacebacteria bacterium]|nr:redox-sensing transcriptional repressor Rex [Candidatus Paceibacterota bacterium]